MSESHPYLQVGVYTADGSAQTFSLDDPELAQRTLQNLHLPSLFTQDRLAIADGDVEVALVPTLITRIDLVTDYLSVWDFPFALGALVEVTEAEFLYGIQSMRQWDRSRPPGDTPVFLDLEMLNGQRLFLWMQVVGGQSRLAKIYSLLKERHLIFGLRTAGIGVLNLSNLVRFSVHPKPPNGESPEQLFELQTQTAENGFGHAHSIHSSHLEDENVRLHENAALDSEGKQEREFS